MNFDDKELTELFCDVFGSEDISRPRGESIDTLRELLNSNNPRCLKFLEKIDHEALRQFSPTLIDGALKQFDMVAFHRVSRLGRIYVNFLYILSLQSRRFRDAVSSTNIQSWMQLLRHDQIRSEILKIINLLTPYMHKAFYFEHAYWRRFLADLAVLGRANGSDDVLYIFIQLLGDHAFLSECHHSMQTLAFENVLVLFKDILEIFSQKVREDPNYKFPNPHPKILFSDYDFPPLIEYQMDQSNIRFCIELLNKLFEEQEINKYLNPSLCKQMVLLLNIIHTASNCRPHFEDSLHDGQTAITCICNILIKLVPTSNIFENRDIPMDHMYHLVRLLFMSTIHLCQKSIKNQINAGQKILKHLIISLTSYAIQDHDLKCYTTNTCKVLCANCPENRQIVEELINTAENNEQKTMFENFAKNFLDSDEVIVPIVNESDDEANESMDDEDEDEFTSEMYDDKWPMSKNEANIQQD